MSCACAEKDRRFWEERVCLLLSEVALIEREILKRSPTTKEMRDAGKKVLTAKDD